MERTLKEKLDESHILFITSDLNAESASEIIFKILKWSNESPKEEIKLYISSETYDFVNAVAIYDVLNNISNPISAFCIGHVGGYATLFLAVATKGKKYALKHTTISLNQPYGFLGSGTNQQTEVEIEARETLHQRITFEEILSKQLGIDLKMIHEDVEADKEFSALEAQKYGLIDEVLR